LEKSTKTTKLKRNAADGLFTKPSAAFAFLFQILMEAKVDFLGQGFGGSVFVEGNGFFQAVDEKEAGVAVFHVVLQVLADLGVEFPVDVLR